MASTKLTQTKISSTYTGIMHANGEALPVTGLIYVYDGVGNKTSLQVSRSGQGISVDGAITSTSNINGSSITTNGVIQNSSIIINGNQINSVPVSTLALAYQAYDGTNTTAYNTVIYDGKNATVATFTGSTKSLTVIGSIQANTFNATSSIRFKENLQPITNALNIVKQLEGVTFTWKESGKRDTGLIAEEVERIAPDFVLKDENGVPLAIDYGRITSVLIEAIKELTILVQSK